jgi:high-affinity K+ transport system ATPase subunit B
MRLLQTTVDALDNFDKASGSRCPRRQSYVDAEMTKTVGGVVHSAGHVGVVSVEQTRTIALGNHVLHTLILYKNTKQVKLHRTPVVSLKTMNK